MIPRIHEDRISLPATDVRSLNWQRGADFLIDWVAGRALYHLDGTTERATVTYAYRFDAAQVSPSGRYTVLYERLGTKAILLHNGRIVRELNRSFYHAHQFEYPVTLLTLPDGREAIAHCPRQYNRLEIEDLQTGACLTVRADCQPTDLFHSRLAASDNGNWLISAGWVWQPVDALEIFDLRRALHDPILLDNTPLPDNLPAPVHSAAFAAEDTLLLSCGANAGAILLTYDLRTMRVRGETHLAQPAGILMPLTPETVVSFYEYPKVIHLPTGDVLQTWRDLKTGNPLSSIIGPDTYLPPLALDPANGRFAVAGVNAITVITLTTNAS